GGACGAAAAAVARQQLAHERVRGGDRSVDPAGGPGQGAARDAGVVQGRGAAVAAEGRTTLQANAARGRRAEGVVLADAEGAAVLAAAVAAGEQPEGACGGGSGRQAAGADGEHGREEQFSHGRAFSAFPGGAG